MKKRHKLAILISAPTAFEVPLYWFIGRIGSIDLTVYFWRTANIHEMTDPELGRPPGWEDLPLTEGYKWMLIPPGLQAQWHLFHSRIFSPGEYDAVIIVGWSGRSARLAILAGLCSQTPFAIASDATLLYPRPVRRSILRSIVFRIFFPYVPAFMPKGTLAREHLLRFAVPDDKVFLFPYAVDNEELRRHCEVYRQQRDRYRSEMNIHRDATAILVVAKLVPREGALQALRAYARVSSSEPNVALVIVGDGAQREVLTQFVRDRQIRGVYFAGYQPYSLLPKYYALADVFVHAALEEPWGLSVNEAMACELPVIVSDRVGAAYDLVRHGENGIIFQGKSVDALADSLMLFLSLPPDQKAKMGERSAELIRGWSYEKTLSEIHRMLCYLDGLAQGATVKSANQHRV